MHSRIFLGIFMAIMTMRFLPLLLVPSEEMGRRSFWQFSSSSIYGASDWLKVIRVHAPSVEASYSTWAIFGIMANMIKLKTIGDRPFRVLVGHDMGSPSLSLVFAHHSVSGLIQRSIPSPTALISYCDVALNSFHDCQFLCSHLYTIQPNGEVWQ